MTQTTARIKVKGKHFEIMVDLDEALKVKKGAGNVAQALQIDKIFTDHKKGFHASEADLNDCFGTDDVYTIADKIIKQGEILLTQDFRDEQRENKIKQVVDFLSRNAIDPRTGNPHTFERIKTALGQSGVNIKNTSIESQIPEIIEKISSILPIKMETKKIRILVPAIHTGKAYGVFSQYKEKENWLSNGDLEVIVSVPSGLLMDFYDKLNAITHGSAITEEIKEKE